MPLDKKALLSFCTLRSGFLVCAGYLIPLRSPLVPLESTGGPPLELAFRIRSFASGHNQRNEPWQRVTPSNMHTLRDKLLRIRESRGIEAGSRCEATTP